MNTIKVINTDHVVDFKVSSNNGVYNFYKRGLLSMKRDIEDIKEKIPSMMAPKCKACELTHGCNAPIPPSLSKERKFLFVGRNPSIEEDKAGEIMTSSYTGSVMFDRYLNKLGLTRGDINLTNIVYCALKRSKYMVPTKCTTKCIEWKYFEQDMWGEPDYIFPMGYDATNVVLGKYAKSVTTILGNMYLAEHKGKRILIIPILHPSHVISDKELLKSMDTFLGVIRKVIEGEINWKEYI